MGESIFFLVSKPASTSKTAVVGYVIRKVNWAPSHWLTATQGAALYVQGKEQFTAVRRETQCELNCKLNTQFGKFQLDSDPQVKANTVYSPQTLFRC